MRVGGNRAQDAVLSFIQDWIKKSGAGKVSQTVELNIYALDKENDVSGVFSAWLFRLAKLILCF